MEFSHSGSLVLDAATMSGMKVGHLCGQSCFNTCGANNAHLTHHLERSFLTGRCSTDSPTSCNLKKSATPQLHVPRICKLGTGQLACMEQVD